MRWKPVDCVVLFLVSIMGIAIFIFIDNFADTTDGKKVIATIISSIIAVVSVYVGHSIGKSEKEHHNKEKKDGN